MKFILTFIFIITFSSGCGSDTTNDTNNNASTGEGTFTVKVDGDVVFDHNSEGASVRFAKEDVIGLKARGWSVRVMANQLAETGPAQTDNLNRNNLLFHTSVTLNGKKQRVGCDPAKTPKGFFKRTELTDTHISGEFSAEFVACNDYYTAKPVDYPDKPFTVTGSFNHIKLK